MASSLDQTHAAATRIRIAGIASAAAQDLLRRADTTVAAAPESLALVPSSDADGAILLAAGNDARGLTYAVTELADRVRHGADPVAALRVDRAIVEQPANSVRSIARCFESDVEDKSWFHDRAMWRQYLAMLATHRFNRFSMTFGLQYNYPMEVSDVYLYFAYPFLFSVPGHEVRVRELPAAERDRNLETLQFIGQETVRRGLDFQVGLWTHGYKFDSPKVNYHVEGITEQNQAAYCRDALALLLRTCPEISGITFRIHGESGHCGGRFRVLADGVCGHRPVRPPRRDRYARQGARPADDRRRAGDRHAGQDIAQISRRAYRPAVSPERGARARAAAAHGGLGALRAQRRLAPLHPLQLRRLPQRGPSPRCAVPDLAGHPARAPVGRSDIHSRLWPPWPASAAAKGSSCASRSPSRGEWVRDARAGGPLYADPTLAPDYDWQKFAYTYRLWGRLTYNPDAAPETWRRQLATDLGSAAAACEAALAQASRILPLITLAHGPSASNNAYWPEMYTNMSIVRDDPPRPYYDAASRRASARSRPSTRRCSRASTNSRRSF